MSERLLIAHRGANRIYTENTLEAILKAYQLGATHAEIDIQRTRDNKLIVFHDPVTTRFDGKMRLIKNVESEYLLNLKMPKGGKLITLDKLLPILKKENKKLVIETKVAGLEDEVIELLDINKFWDNALVWSFNHDTIKNFHEKCGKKLKKAILLTIRPIKHKDILKRVVECGADYLYPVYRSVNIKYFIDNGIKLVKYCNNSQKAKQFLEAGGSALMSDDMELLRQARSNK